MAHNHPIHPSIRPPPVHSCVFETKPQTVQSFLTELEHAFTQARLTVGGYIAVLGGDVAISGCEWPSRHTNMHDISMSAPRRC